MRIFPPEEAGIGDPESREMNEVERGRLHMGRCGLGGGSLWKR